jgi:hypothetical protein
MCALNQAIGELHGQVEVKIHCTRNLLRHLQSHEKI